MKHFILSLNSVLLLLIGFTLLVGIYLHGNFVNENRKREGLIAEQEFYLAQIWAENECLKEQLGIFNAPNGCKEHR